MTGKQCQSARRLLGWSRRQLSERLGGHPSAHGIGNFERQWKTIRLANCAALRGEFENAGIEFDPDGVTVRLHKR